MKLASPSNSETVLIEGSSTSLIHRLLSYTFHTASDKSLGRPGYKARVALRCKHSLIWPFYAFHNSEWRQEFHVSALGQLIAIGGNMAV